MKRPPFDLGLWGLPHFVGALKDQCFMRPTASVSRREYVRYPSRVSSINIALQLPLWIVTRVMCATRGRSSSFAFPTIELPVAVLTVPKQASRPS